MMREMRENTNKTVHKSRLFKGNVFNQTLTEKAKVHSLGASNKSIHKKTDDMHQFKKTQ